MDNKINSIRITEGEPVSESVDNSIRSRITDQYSNDYRKFVKQKTIDYIKVCLVDDFGGFKSEIINNIKEMIRGLFVEKRQEINYIALQYYLPHDIGFIIEGHDCYRLSSANADYANSIFQKLPESISSLFVKNDTILQSLIERTLIKPLIGYNDEKLISATDIQLTKDLIKEHPEVSTILDLSYWDLTLSNYSEAYIERMMEVISNMRCLSNLKKFSVFDDIYQFVFVLKSYQHRNNYNGNNFDEFLSLVLSKMPSYFFIHTYLEYAYRNSHESITRIGIQYIEASLLSAHEGVKDSIKHYATSNQEYYYPRDEILRYIDTSIKRDYKFINELIGIQFCMNSKPNEEIRLEVIEDFHKAYKKHKQLAEDKILPNIYANIRSYFERNGIGSLLDDCNEDIYLTNLSVRLIDGLPEPEVTKMEIILNQTRGVETGFEDCIKPQTIEYLKECLEDNFQLFKSEISDNYQKHYVYIDRLVYDINSIEQLSATSVYRFSLELKMDEQNLETTLKTIANIRDLDLLNSLTTLDDVYQFSFVMQYYLIKDDKSNTFEDKLILAYRNIPSHFYNAYFDEGGSIETPNIDLIHSEMLSGNKNYKEQIINYASKSSSLVSTDINDQGEVLFQSITPLRYIDSSIKSDVEFVKKLVDTDVTLLQHMHTSVRNSKEVVLQAYNAYIKDPRFEINYSSGFFDNSLYEEFTRGIGDALKEDELFMRTIPELPYSEEEYMKEQTIRDISESKAGSEDYEDLPF